MLALPEKLQELSERKPPLPLEKGVKSPKLLSRIPICDQKKGIWPNAKRKGKDSLLTVLQTSPARN